MGNKKKIIWSICICLIVSISVVGYILYRQSKEKVKASEEINYGSPKSIQDTGIGAGGTEDVYWVTKNPPWYYRSIPNGKIVYVHALGTENKIEVKKGLDRELLNHDKLEVIIYNAVTKNTEKTIDVKEIIKEKAPDYQYVMWDFIGQDKEGEFYLFLHLEEIPLKGMDEAKKMYLIINLWSEEVIFTDTYRPDFIQNVKKEYSNELYETDWNTFYRENNLSEDWILPHTRDFQWTVSDVGNDSVTISMSTEVLPHKNGQLYSRYPGLSKWKDKEALFVGIVLGGRPTAEVIQSMFVEEP